MIRLRPFVILSSLVVVLLTLAVSWVQMKNVLERGAQTLEKKELEHISQIVRTVIEIKRSELKNYTQMIRTNNDFASAYLIAKEGGDADLINSKLQKIKKEIRFDFVEILTPEGKPIYSFQSEIAQETLLRILGVKSGLLSATLFGKPALISFSPLTLYEEPIGTVVLGYYLQGEISEELSRLTDAEVGFALVRPLEEASQMPKIESRQGMLTFDLGGAELAPLQATIHLKSNAAQSFWKLFSSRLTFSVVLSLGLLLLVLYCFLEFGFIREFRNFAEEVKRASEDVDRGVPRELPVGSSYILESQLLFKTTQKLVASLIAYQRRTQQQVILEETARKQTALGELAGQVAHDIRSPLSALLMATYSLTQVPEQNRLLIRRAVSRIQDIANNLLTSRKEMEVEPVALAIEPRPPSDEQSVQLLFSLIEAIISEKRMQIRHRIGIQIEAKLDQYSYGLFANVQSATFKTILSNLLNNSLEAIDFSGHILVNLEEKGDAIEIAIKDDGRGISKELLPKLGTRGGSFNKKDGMGLGLFHARTNLESWGGKLRLESTEGIGTSVTLTLPKASPPQWFVPSINLDSIDTIIVVDDDISVHQIWEKRFKESSLSALPPILHLSTPRQLVDWKEREGNDGKNVLYLVDYEFLGEVENGLSLIETLGIEAQSILVTSHFEESRIVERCQARDIRLLPKGMAGFVPIRNLQLLPA